MRKAGKKAAWVWWFNTHRIGIDLYLKEEMNKKKQKGGAIQNHQKEIKASGNKIWGVVKGTPRSLGEKGGKKAKKGKTHPVVTKGCCKKEKAKKQGNGVHVTPFGGGVEGAKEKNIFIDVPGRIGSAWVYGSKYRGQTGRGVEVGKTLQPRQNTWARKRKRKWVKSEKGQVRGLKKKF